MADENIEPIQNFSFSVEVDPGIKAQFIECSGLHVTVEAVPFRACGDPVGQVRRVPGQRIYHPMEFKWGVCKSPDLWDWFETGLKGEPARRLVQVLVLNADGSKAYQWNLIDAWIGEWKAKPLNTLGSEVAVESMLVFFERVERDGNVSTA